MTTYLAKLGLADVSDSDDLVDWPAQVNAMLDRLAQSAPMAGQVSVSTAGTVVGTAAVVFGAGRFAAAPRVVATFEGGNSNYFTKVNNVTASGCDISIIHRDGTSTTAGPFTVNWLAMVNG